ncbi:MAG: zinc ABC transporter substrate-binding protein [gamma proteobacterium symbiont of Ctena orbiculata]|nr:MAG: zinc ABC transporter substrate-binding protein [gamma proteobacterium symbiont of Ctena orbiculata]
MTPLRHYFSLIMVLCSLAGNAHGALNVVVSLKPVHSLLASLMLDVAEPRLLLDDSQSPHGMSLKPSQIRMLNEADLIVWVGASLEPALSHLLQRQSFEAPILSLLETPDLHLLPIRNRREWRSHGHSHDHNDSHPDQAVISAMLDNHIWLSPENAAAMVRHLTQKLIELDNAHSAAYRKNSRELLNRLNTFDNVIRTRLKPVANTPYIVFHDAYQYFEAHYGMHTVGTVNITPDQLSGARHIHRLRQTIEQRGARCLFTEPQFEPKLAHTLVEGLAVKIGELDPLGEQLPPGPDCYFSLMRGLADNLLNCLSGELPK